MKKTLAILLALLAAASITLASCEKEPTTNVDGWDDDNDYVESKDDDSDMDESDSGSDADNDQGNNGNNTTPSNGWTEASGNIYLGMNVILRKAPDELASSKTDKKLSFGTALTRVRTNGRWEEVKISGDETLYYVKSIYTTDAAGNFKFTEDAEKPTLTLSTTTDNNVCFYKTPFYCDDSESNFANMLCKSGIKAVHLKGNAEGETYSLKKLAVSENGKWVKVEFVGTVEISTNNKATYTSDAPGVFYIQALSFTREDIIGGGITSGGNNTDDGDYVS